MFKRCLEGVEMLCEILERRCSRGGFQRSEKMFEFFESGFYMFEACLNNRFGQFCFFGKSLLLVLPWLLLLWRVLSSV